MDLTRYQLDNGLTVLLLPSTTAPVVACNVWVGVGSADETPSEAGLAHVHEHMLFKGTQRRKVGEIAREIESSGGYINAFTSFDQTCYYVVMSSRYFDAGLDILSDAICNSSFDAEELERELEVIQEEIKRSEDTPSRVATLKLFETAFQTHPYRLPVIGTSESVDSFTREHVLEFYRKHYVPSNMVLVLAGDFELDDARQKVEHFFGNFQAADFIPVERPAEPAQQEIRSDIRAREVQESYLRLGFHVPDAMHEDIPALDLLGAIMGYGDASHLYQIIQREKELVNSIHASSYTPKDAGLYMISADFQLSDDDDSITSEVVIRAIMEEVFRFREMQVSNIDLQRARTLIESQQIYGKQTVEGLAMKYGYYELTVGDALFEKQYYEALAKVTPAQIREVARKYLTVENCTLVLHHPQTQQSLSPEILRQEVEKAYTVIESEAVDTSISPDSDGFVRLKLPDGPMLIIQEDHSVETFAIRCLSMGGLRYESPANNGINALLNDLLIAGTDRRSAVEISQEVESMAASISGISGRNSFGLAMNGLSRFFEPCFDVFADCMLHASIPDEEFERERKLQLQNIRSRQDQLGVVNYEQFCKSFFAPHPYSLPILGNEENLATFSAELLRDYLAQLVQVDQLVLSVVGNVRTQDVIQLAERYFVRSEHAKRTEPTFDMPARRQKPELVVTRLDKNQAHITVGFPAPTLGTTQAYALEVLYAILSGQGGRLFYELRDRQSLAYSVYASTIMGLDASAFTINIGTSPEKVHQALYGMLAEVKKLRDNPPTLEELERAKRYLIGNHDIGLQKNSSRAMTFGLDELYGLNYRRTLEYGDHISAVTLDSISALAENYLNINTVLTAIVAPSDADIPEDLLDATLAQLND